MHRPEFPPTFYDWQPCNFPEPPLPYWTLHTDPDPTRDKLKERWAKPLIRGWMTKVVNTEPTKKQLEMGSERLLEKLLR